MKHQRTLLQAHLPPLVNGTLHCCPGITDNLPLSPLVPQHQPMQPSCSAQLPPRVLDPANAALRWCAPAATPLSTSKHRPQAARSCHPVVKLKLMQPSGWRDPAATPLSASKHGPQAARTCHASPGPYEVALLQQLGLSRNRGVVAGQSVNDAVLQTDGGSQRQRRGHYAEA